MKNHGPGEGFYCHTCGQWHEGVAMDVGFDFPAYYLAVPERERETRTTWDRDFCTVDDHRFIRGCLEIPVVDFGDTQEDRFIYGVWTTLSKTNFDRAKLLWHAPLPANEPPYYGWLSNRLPGYPDTINLKVEVRLRDGRLRPRMLLEPTDHPFAVEQRNGITMRRVHEILEKYVHPQ